MHSPPPLSSPAAHSSSISENSAFLSCLSVIVLITVIVLIYAIFFAIKCPSNPFDRHRRSSGRLGTGGLTDQTLNASNTDHLVSGVTFKEEAVNAAGGECPVCLSAFMEGEVIRQVSACKHLFHAACIDMWLCSHPNCPVCRAFIGTNRPKPPPPPPPPVVEVDGEGDFRQGLPDSASLV